MEFPQGLSEQLSAREKDGTLRTLKINEGLVDFYSNDYLGLASDKEIAQRAHHLAERLTHVNGSTGSRLISGNSVAHEELEVQLAGFFRSEASLLFNSGYDANVGLLSALLQRNDSIFFDRLSHASIRDGISMSHARAFGFDHNDLEDLDRKVRKGRSGSGQNYVIAESVYSMDGDEAPLEELASYCQQQGLYLIVDEAHSTGILGPAGAGMTVSLGLEDKVFARVHTFGKAMGCHGAAVLGSTTLRNFLVNFARSFIYTTALPAVEVLRIGAALEELRREGRRERLRNNIGLFLETVRELKLEDCFIRSRSPIQSFLLKDKIQAKEISEALYRERIGSKVIMAPTVPVGGERVRICIHSFNTPEEIRRLLRLLSTFV